MEDLDFETGKLFTIVKKSRDVSTYPNNKLLILIRKTEVNGTNHYYLSLPPWLQSEEVYPSHVEPFIDLTKRWSDEIWRPLQLRYDVRDKVKGFLAMRKRQKATTRLLIVLNKANFRYDRHIIRNIVGYL